MAIGTQGVELELSTHSTHMPEMLVKINFTALTNINYYFAHLKLHFSFHAASIHPRAMKLPVTTWSKLPYIIGVIPQLSNHLAPEHLLNHNLTVQYIAGGKAKLPLLEF